MAKIQIAPSDLRLASPREFTQIQFASDPGEALEGINTTNMPNGALCYCVDNRALYILDKSSTEAAVLDVVVAPIAGPGRWFMSLINPSGSVSPFSASVYLDNPPATIDVTDNTGKWMALPSAQYIREGSFFSDIFVLDLATGVITYNGPDQTYLAVVTVSIGAADDAIIDAAVDAAGTSQTTLIGTTSTPNFSQNSNYTAATLSRLVISAPRMLTLQAGNTIQGTFRNVTEADDLTVYKYSLNITPA